MHGTNSYSHNTENNPFTSIIICGNCTKIDVLECYNKEHFIEKWKMQSQGDDLLLAYRAKRLIDLVQDAEPIEVMKTDFMLETLDYIRVFENGLLLVVFLDGTEIECKNDEKK